ncbi:MAG: DUF3891 family protein [Acidobacteriota bacterium]
MLKTERNGVYWLVTQPDHGAVAGYMAAHWGNDQFAVPGGHSQAADPAELRAETVLAIAEHDNGWWEWEAAPKLSDVDHLPQDLREVLANQSDGMDRWRRGVPRLGEHHPYASLLISFHAYWLYAAKSEPGPAFLHPLFWNAPPEKLFQGPLEQAREYVQEIAAMQGPYLARLRQDRRTASWLEAANLKPAVRLLQLLDGLSLYLCSPLIPAASGTSKGFGEDAIELLETPRRSWQDRVKISVRPLGNRRIALDPYPFDVDPLPVTVPVRIVDRAKVGRGPFSVWWRSEQPRWLEYELTARA